MQLEWTLCSRGRVEFIERNKKYLKKGKIKVIHGSVPKQM